MQKKYDVPNLQATEKLAQKIAPYLRVEDVILLSGPMGVGKTAFVRALLRSVCNDSEMEVPSPSFTLVQIYDGPEFSLYHYDLWRLDHEQDLIELDWEDAREGVVLVEWPERLPDFFPDNALHISFSLNSEGLRQIILSGWDQRLAFIK